VATTNANASVSRVVVAGSTPVANSVTVVNKTITSTVDVALRSAHPNALTTFLADVNNTASPYYHDFLTPTQYATRFGASKMAVTAVSHYLASYGLVVGALSAGHDILRATGSTRELARALDAPIETVRLSDGALTPNLTSSASLPKEVAKYVVSVAGLSASDQPQSQSLSAHAVTTPTTCASAGSSTGTTPNSLGGYTVSQQAQLYGLSSAWAAGDTGAGQTIGVYELSNYDTADVATFFSCYGIAPKITAINVDGGPTADDNADGAGEEATLDVEEAAALAPGATIEVYQGTNSGNGPTDIYTQIASDDTADVITTSWGNCEAASDGGAQAEQVIFQEMAAQGQTVVSAAGDEGSSDCEGSQQGGSELAVDDPASQPYVTGVGGLTVSNISPLSEKVWNDGCTQSDCGSGGGGLSSLWSQPAWQTGDGITTSAATGGKRMVPDLSVMADPETGFIEYYTGTTDGVCRHTCTTGWSGIGGTSIGAPLVSALVAVAAQVCGVSRLGFINPTLYSMPTSDFVDVTSGNNDLFNVGGYNATVGYDMASGLGSPNGYSFLSGLCPPKFDLAKSSLSVTGNNAAALSSGPTVTTVLHDTNGNPIANASVEVTATAKAGELVIDNYRASSTGTGTASYDVTTDTTGTASFNVTSTLAQDVDVKVSYQGTTIFTTTLTYKAATVAASKPGAPTIASLRPLIAGFRLVIKPPASNGGSPVTSYQYSLTNGATWKALAKGTTAVTVTGLGRGVAYSVVVRALNAVGPSAKSAAKRVVTRS